MDTTSRCTLHVSTFFAAGCASNSGNFDPNAHESIGRIINKRSARSFQRTVEPVGGTAAAVATGGYLGYIIARGLFFQSNNIALFEYTVELKNKRQLLILSEWGSYEVGTRVRAFESPSGRKDYPRITSDSGC